MDLLPQLRITHRRCAHHVQVVMILAALPLFLAGMVIFAHRGGGGPALWMIAGLSLSHVLLLWGAHRMHGVTLRRTALATRFVARSDAWFPYLVLLIQGGVAAAFALLGWVTLVDLGFRGTPFHFALLLLVLGIWPLRRCIRFALFMRESRSLELFHIFTYFTQRIVVTLFIAASLANALAPAGPRYAAGFPMAEVLVWVPAILVALIQIVLFIDHITRKAPTEPSYTPTDRI